VTEILTVRCLLAVFQKKRKSVSLKMLLLNLVALKMFGFHEIVPVLALSFLTNAMTLKMPLML